LKKPIDVTIGTMFNRAVKSIEWIEDLNVPDAIPEEVHGSSGQSTRRTQCCASNMNGECSVVNCPSPSTFGLDAQDVPLNNDGHICPAHDNLIPKMEQIARTIYWNLQSSCWLQQNVPTLQVPACFVQEMAGCLLMPPSRFLLRATFRAPR
jgi:hypothetical protein